MTIADLAATGDPAVSDDFVVVRRSDLFVTFMLATGHQPVEGSLTPFALERIASAIGGCISDSTAVELAQPVSVSLPDRDAFDEFWELYPRRIGKIAARKAFDKAVASVGAQKVLAGAWDFHHHWKGQPKSRMKYVPHPATWLNQGRWDDELDAEVEHATDSRVRETRENLVDGLSKHATMPSARERLANRQAALEAGGL